LAESTKTVFLSGAESWDALIRRQSKECALFVPLTYLIADDRSFLLSVAIDGISDCIEGFYDQRRRHSHLGGVSPEAFESAHRRRPRYVH
jgi:hypothetical protein